MASFAGSSKDTVADLLVDKSASPPPGAKPAKAPDTEKKHYSNNNDGETMEALLEGAIAASRRNHFIQTHRLQESRRGVVSFPILRPFAGSGGPDTPRIESKKHLPPPPDAMVGGEVGLTTDSQAPFVPSIAMVTEKPSDNGNLTNQDIEPSDVSPQHISTKRMFDDKPCGVESEPSDGHPPKRSRADLDDSRVKAALDETAPSNDVQQPPSKKQVLDAANKQSHVLQDAASPPVQKFARKHFDPTDNALKDSVVL